MSITLDQARMRTPATGAEYRTLWRWHFYAGLFVMPFLLVLAITGTLYCFKPQLEPLLYPQLLRVQPQATAKLDADRLLAAAQRSLPAGSVPVSLQVQDGADRSAEFVFRLPDAQSWSVYVNPYDGHVLGRLSVSNRIMQVTRMLHRKLLLGKPGELLMELVACWTLVMIGTGIALWWPRPQNGQRPQLRPDFSLEGRPSGAVCMPRWDLAGRGRAGIRADRHAVDRLMGPLFQVAGREHESGRRRAPGAAAASAPSGRARRVRRQQARQRAHRCRTITRAMTLNPRA